MTSHDAISHDVAILRKADHRMLFMFVAVTIISLVLALRAQATTDAVRDSVRHSCQVRNTNAQALNRLIDSLIDAVGQTTSLPGPEKVRRIATYNASRAVIQDCP